jgi:hypothetical protein
MRRGAGRAVHLCPGNAAGAPLPYAGVPARVHHEPRVLVNRPGREPRTMRSDPAVVRRTGADGEVWGRSQGPNSPDRGKTD